MKLTRIPGAEQTVKHSFSLKASTTAHVQAYHRLYCQKFGLDPRTVPLKDIVEQILIDFMANDRDFQRQLAEQEQKAGGQAASKPANAPVAPSLPAASSASSENPSDH